MTKSCRRDPRPRVHPALLQPSNFVLLREFGFVGSGVGIKKRNAQMFGGAAAAPVGAFTGRRNQRLPPEVNRILYVRNLPYKISPDELYDIFGKYGSIRQIRKGNTTETRGTAFVVYDDIYDAKNAMDHLSGFNVANRYLVLLYYNATKFQQKADLQKKKEELDAMKKKYRDII
eukprot:GEMP01095675.1.p1 GENE.GEMP01095675.1~~GEMP01095675.1.p1  ORF type:complete len:174 (+),score=27.81 GEMP01095675.1:120-641(+)